MLVKLWKIRYNKHVENSWRAVERQGRLFPQKVAVKRVSWKGETTVYIYPRDLQPFPMSDIKEIIISVE